MSTSRTEFQDQWSAAIARVYRAIASTDRRDREVRQRTGQPDPTTDYMRASIRVAIDGLEVEARTQAARHRVGVDPAGLAS